MKHTTRRVPRGGARFLIAVLGILSGAAAGAAGHAASASALHVIATTPAPPGSKPNNAKRKVIVSPYARAAAAHARAGQASGHAPAMMQGMGSLHRARGAGGRN